MTNPTTLQRLGGAVAAAILSIALLSPYDFAALARLAAGLGG